MPVLGHQRHGGQRRHARLAGGNDVGVRTHRLQEVDDVLRVFVEAEAPAFERHVAYVVPVGDVDVVILQRGADRVAQQRREVPGHRRHDEYLGLPRYALLAKAQQRRERRGGDDFLGDGAGLAMDDDAVDAPRRALAADLGQRQHLAGRGHRPRGGAERRTPSWTVEHRNRPLRPSAKRPEQVRLGLECLIHRVCSPCDDGSGDAMTRSTTRASCLPSGGPQRRTSPLARRSRRSKRRRLR